MIPLNTTMIAILRLSTAALDDEPYQVATANYVTVATGIRAVIAIGGQQGSGSERSKGGEQSALSASLTADPCDLVYTDRIQDEITGELWQVTWSTQRVGLGLDHTKAGLYQVKGRV